MFSPDGTKIAFTSNRDGNTEIYVMDADGTDQTRITNRPGGDSQPQLVTGRHAHRLALLYRSSTLRSATSGS